MSGQEDHEAGFLVRSMLWFGAVKAIRITAFFAQLDAVYQMHFSAAHAVI